ncbi:MFS transporter [Dactylosporangium darangshiense]|uniref:MFS transporter n=1 Tax=Dactylosporangium darangshiense TaxID=579108 RepID=A0ABP8DDX2_9ACTN
MSEAKRKALWRDRDVAIFLGVQTLSAFGDACTFAAVPLLMRTGAISITGVGWVRALEAVATLLTGIVAGVIADRFDRRTVLRVCDAARFVLLGAIPLVWLAGPQPWLLFVVLPAAAVFSMVFQVTYVTVVPALVPKERINDANGLLYGSYSIAWLAGPAVAGLVSQAAGPAAAIGIDAVSFALSAIGLYLVRLHNPAGGTERGLGAGVHFIRRHPVMLSLTVLLAVLIFFTSSLNDVIVYHLMTGLGQPDSVIGLVLTAGVLGSTFAAAAVAPLRRRVGFGATWIGAYTLCGAIVAGIGVATHVPAVAVLAAGVTLCTGVAGIASMSLRQEVTPAPLLGRVTSAFWTLQLVLAPAGDAVLTFAAKHAGVPATLAVAGATITVTALAALLTPLGRRTASAPPPPT